MKPATNFGYIYKDSMIFFSDYPLSYLPCFQFGFRAFVAQKGS